ncbi:MAG TPA: LysE family transporter [Candidatus Fimousia stercorigallinarum]|nr:LysE family transporter [Candidatus Fimousia stercorigallinarum]
MFPVSDFLIYCFITAYTPGANNLLSMSNAARLGFRKSVSFNFGITMGFLIVMTVCTLFSSTLYSALPKVKFYMQLLGAAYMLYLAWKVWKTSSDLEVESRKESSFLSGMVLQFMNPKIYIYAITAMSLYILPLYHSVVALIVFVLILTIIGASGSYVWALFGSAFCRFFTKHTKGVNLVMALLLVYCAVSLYLD